MKCPGDPEDWGGEFVVVVAQTIPAGTLPARSLGYRGPDPAEDFCEPCLVTIKHQRDDRWVRTHWMSYTLFRLEKRVRIFTGFRVQEGYRRGPFLSRQQMREVVEHG